MYSYRKMDTDTEPKPKSTYNREKYEQNKENIVAEFGVVNVIILARRVCNRVGGDLIYISFIHLQRGGIHVRHPKTHNLANHGIRQRARVPPTLSPTNLPITHQTLSILSNQNTLCLLLRNIQHTLSLSISLDIICIRMYLYILHTETEGGREREREREREKDPERF
jgi:hypothetical protein